MVTQARLVHVGGRGSKLQPHFSYAITCKAGTCHCYCLERVQECSWVCSCSLAPKERSNWSGGTWHRWDPLLMLELLH